MPTFIQPFLSLLIPAIAGWLAKVSFNYVDDVQKWTAKLPADVKRLVVSVLCMALTALNQRYGLSLPTGGALTEPAVQAAIASTVAFFIYHATPPAQQPGK